MKKLFYLFALGLSLSCSIEHSIPDDYEHQGEWELTRTLTNMTDAEKDENPDIIESYFFRQNGTFKKIRWEKNSELSAEGTYKIDRSSSHESEEILLSLDLTFENEDSPLIANCSAEPVEHLVITSEFVLTNTWIMCDGLGMEYEKEEAADI